MYYLDYFSNDKNSLLNETGVTVDTLDMLKKKISRNVYYDENFEIYSNRNIDIKNLINKVLFKLEKTANMMRFELKRKINIHIVDSRDDFLMLSKDFYWCTGLSCADDIFIIHPNDYKGTLYSNVLLHECLHCLIYQIYGEERCRLKYEEGFAVLFSTPLLDWKRELMKDENLYYLYEAEHLKNIYIEKGMDGVIAEMTSEMTLKEEYIIDIENERKVPVYLFLLSGKSRFAGLIKAGTKSKYSHSGLAITTTFDKIFSYNLNAVGGGQGFSIESLNDYKRECGDNFEFKINVLFIPERNFRELKTRINWYTEHKNETKYNIYNLFKIVFGSKIKEVKDLNMVCSTFVGCILNYCGISIGSKDPTLLTPKDIEKLEDNKKIFKLFEGTYKEFNQNSIKGKLNNIKKHAMMITEGSSVFTDID